MKKSTKVLLLLLVAVFSLAMVGNAWGKAAPIELAFSEQDDPNAYDPTWDQTIKEFQAKNPGIVVKRSHTETEGQRTDWMNSVLAGAGPDLISCPHDNVGVFGTAETAMVLDKVFTKSFYAQFSQKDINDYKFDGKIYGIPYKVGNCLALIYNKKLVAAPPKTMDELVQKAQALTKAPDQYGLVFDMVEPFFSIPFLGGYEGRVFDQKGNLTLNTDAMKKMMQLVYDLKNTYKITPKEANTDVANALFKEGKAAMIINGPWFYGDATKAGIDIGIARLPKLTGGTWPAPYTGAKVLMINPNIKNKARLDAVKKFVTFLNTPEIQVRLAKASSEFPTNLKALTDPYVTSDERMKSLADQMKAGTPMPYQPEMRAVWDTVRTVQAEVLGGTTKPEDAPKKMQEQAANLIKTQFGK